MGSFTKEEYVDRVGLGRDEPLEYHLARVIRLSKTSVAALHGESAMISGEHTVSYEECEHKDCQSIRHMERILVAMLKANKAGARV